MRRLLSERNLVIALFVIVLVIFSLAQEATKKLDRFYLETDPAGIAPVAENN